MKKARFEFIAVLGCQHSVSEPCSALRVTRQGCYAHRKSAASEHALRDAELAAKIFDVYEASRRIYGSPKAFQVLKRGGERVSRKRVARIMRANGIRAGHIHRHSRLRGPRQARLVLRARAAQQAVRHVDIVGVRVAAGQQEAEEPAHILLQLPCAQPQPMGRILRALPRQGHAARQGAESRGEEAAQGDLRDHEGQGSVRSLTAAGDRRPCRACVSIAKNARRKGESPLTEL